MVAFRPPYLWAQESFVPVKQLVGEISFMLAFDCIDRMVQTTNSSEAAAIPHRVLWAPAEVLPQKDHASGGTEVTCPT